MKTLRPAYLTFILLFLGSICGAYEHVEIVLDASAEMWKGVGGSKPRFVAVREALKDYVAASVQRQGRPEVALRIVGGGTSLVDGAWCNDTQLLLGFSVVEPDSCREALADLVPGGGRPLVHGLNQAMVDLASVQGGRRIVVITAGSDQCHQDVIGTLKGIMESDPPIEVRIIGLGLDQTMANAATILAPTRNLFDLATLPETLDWALQPTDTRPAMARHLEIHLSLDGTLISSAEIELVNAEGGEKAYAAVEDGRARVRVNPGRYRARIQFDNQPPITLAGLVVGDHDGTVELDLTNGPPVTLDIDPWPPVAGGPAHIAFWGAPTADTWVTLAMPGSAADEYLIRAQTAGSRGEVALHLPDSISELEVRFAVELQPGVFQIIGNRTFKTEYPRAKIESLEEIENGTPIEISWTGPGHEGEHITISTRDAADTDHVVCFPVVHQEGTVTATAPADTGDYVIFYRSAMGRILDRKTLVVFEVLATLEGPATAEPAEEVAISWTGPDAADDYLSITRPESADEEYLKWAPTTDGNPARLQVPTDPGSYEIRYVRSADSTVLARHALEIESRKRRVKVPKSVAAGSRFSVRWSGTARKGDYLTVAVAGSDARERLDFSYATAGSPLSLAAPFETGLYEVRYISGSTQEIETTVPLRVR